MAESDKYNQIEPDDSRPAIEESSSNIFGNIRSHVDTRAAIVASGLIMAGAALRGVFETPAFSQVPVPEATATPDPTGENDADASREQLIRICRDQALGAISGVGIDVMPNRRAIRWNYNNENIDEDCKKFGSWTIKLMLKKSLRKRLGPQYIKKDGHMVKTNKIVINNPTDEHGTYYRKLYFKNQYPAAVSDADIVEVSWAENGKEPESRRYKGLADTTYR